MTDREATNEGRRNFLKLATVAAPAAAAAATVADASEEAIAEEQQGSGLRMTAHVKAYLDSARF